MSELCSPRSARTRDVELFELLFRHFAPRVKAYMARTGSPAAAEELMQETMVAVWNKAALYDPAKGAASTWIFSIARNLRIDAYRREKHPEFDENDPAFQPAAEPAADSRLEAEQSARLVRAALATLPPDQAEVLRLAYLRGQFAERHRRGARSAARHGQVAHAPGLRQAARRARRTGELP